MVPGHVLSPNSPFPWSDLGPTPQTHLARFSRFAGPPNMDRSIVFARWRQCAPHVTHGSFHPGPQPKRHLDRLSHICTAHGRMSSDMTEHVLSPKNCRFAWGHLDPWFIRPTRVHNPNGISIDSAISAQLTQSVVGHALACPFP